MNSLVDAVTVVVVNWNSGHQLRACVDSIFRFGGAMVREVIIVDNDSKDGSAESVKGVPSTRILLPGTNLGFGKACNLGAEHANTDYILFLNPDAALKEGTLGKVCSFMLQARNVDVGICGVQLIGEDGHVARSCSRFPSLLRFIAHAVGVDRLIPQAGHAMAEWSHNESREVDQVIGAFFFVRTSLFRDLGGFDEDFFMYYEEVDFSYRAHRAGSRSHYIADGQAFHAGGGTSRQIKARRLFYSLRSRLIYAEKHFSRFDRLAVLAVTFLVEPCFRIGGALVRGTWESIKETSSAYRMLFVWFICRHEKGSAA